ncbi:MAG: hypothetical protein ACI87H_001302 [Gammaproteobacteria bacterium]|jgi:hypothetical protein
MRINTLVVLIFIVLIKGCATAVYNVSIPGKSDIDRIFVSDGNSASLVATENFGNVVLTGPKVELLIDFLGRINNNFLEPWATLPPPKYTIEIITNSGKRSFLFVSADAIAGRIYDKNNRLLRVIRPLNKGEAKELESLAFSE